LAADLPIILHVGRIVMLHRGGQHVVIGAIVAAPGKNSQQEGCDGVTTQRIAGVVYPLSESPRGLQAKWITKILIVIDHETEIETCVNRIAAMDRGNGRSQREGVRVVEALEAANGLVVGELTPPKPVAASRASTT